MPLTLRHRRTHGVFVAAANAPADVKAEAEYVCTGTGDQATINAALTVATANRRQVILSTGTFNISGPILLPQGCSLVGQGWASTHIQATGTWATTDTRLAQGAMIELSGNADRTTVKHMRLWGNRGIATNDVMGIYYHNPSNTGFIEGTDSFHTIEYVYIHETRRHGIYFDGVNNRANQVSNVRMFSLGTRGSTVASGFVDLGNDSFYNQVDVGAVTGYGFDIKAGNNRFVNCKAWFCRLSGFYINATRNQLSACESQDNTQHGYLIDQGHVSLSACHADSNGYDESPSNAMTGNNAYDGFHVTAANYVELVGCMAYDKNEGARGLRQRFGFNLINSLNTRVTGTAFSNVTAGVANWNGYGPGTNPGNDVSIGGQTVVRYPIENDITLLSVGTAIGLTASTAGPAEVSGTARQTRTIVDLSQATECRVIAMVNVLGNSTTAYVRADYRTTADPATWASTGALSTNTIIGTGTANTLHVGTWQAIPAAARIADCYVAAMFGSTSTTQPTVSSIVLQVR